MHKKIKFKLLESCINSSTLVRLKPYMSQFVYKRRNICTKKGQMMNMKTFHISLPQGFPPVCITALCYRLPPGPKALSQYSGQMTPHYLIHDVLPQSSTPGFSLCSSLPHRILSHLCLAARPCGGCQ